MSRRVVLVSILTLGLSTAVASAQPENQPVYQQALEHLSAGDIDAAIQTLEQQPENSATLQTRALLGALYLETDRAQDALNVLQPLCQPADADPGVLYNAGRAAIRLGQLDLAESYLARSLETSPGSPAARELGLLKGAQGDYRAAYSLLVPWAKQDPSDIEARLAAAVSALNLERAPTAEELLSDLPQDQPRVRVLWGRLLLLKGDPYGAAATLQPLLEDADSDPVLAEDTRSLLADAYIMAGNSAAAITVLEGHTANDPAAALRLSQAYYLGGDLEAALAALAPFAERLASTEIPADHPELPLAERILMHYGKLLSLRQRPDEALLYLRLATELDPADGQAWQTLAQVLAAQGESEEANAAAQRFRDIAEGNKRRTADDVEEELRDPTGVQIQLGLQALYSGQADKALEIARSEAKLAPEDPRPALLEARALLDLDRPEEALDASERLVARYPDLADALYLRGVVRMAFDDLDRAETDLRAAIEIQPQHVAALNDLAVLLMQRGENVEARELLERALAVFPDDPTAKTNLERLPSD